MGGNTQTQPNSSFFGNNTPNLLTSKPNTNTPSGSLFGQSNTATPTTGSFFGNQPTNNQAIATPMFGGLTQNTTQPQTGSLFGTSAFGQNTAQKPLFGGASTQISSNTNTNTSGGLFNTGGGNAGLFSQPNQQTGGIFGNSTQPNTFGNNFMNKPNEPSGTGLFGNLTTPQNQAQQPQTGLFNQSQPMYNQTQPSFGQPNQNNNMNYPQTGIFQGNPQQAQAQQTMDMNMGRTPGYYPFDPNSMQNQPNSMFTGSQLFTNAPNQNNWLYHDWDKEYQSFYGSNYEDSDDLGFFPYIPYKKRDNNIRNPNMFKNMTISSRKNETRDGNEFLGEKKKNLGLERRKEYQDREPNVLGYNQSGSSLLKGSYREEDNRRGFAGDRERIQGIFLKN